MAIHNCPHCGAIVPYAGAQCSNCARRRENERRSMNSGSGSGSRSGNSGNVTYSGGSSYSTGHSGGKSSILPFEEILWSYFTLQDAVDFAKYAVETTIQTMRFKNVVETVGGSVDILVITPDETNWLQKEQLT